MIQSFGDKRTERIWNLELSKGFDRQLAQVAVRKLQMLNAAANLNDLRVPPGNRLEALSGDRVGQHSVRIDGQWRICFRWTESGPFDVEIVDYH